MVLLKTLLIKPVKVLIGSPTLVKVNEEISFEVTVHPTDKGYHLYQIGHSQGQFEIEKIAVPEEGIVLPFDKHDKKFASNYHFEEYDFHLLTDIEFNSIKTEDFVEKVQRNLLRINVPKDKLDSLQPFECFKNEIQVSEIFKVIIYLKKLENGIAEVHIENPDHLGINDNFGDFRVHFEAAGSLEFDLALDFTSVKKKLSRSSQEQIPV